ncbi:MAG TPA: hypothetical protein VFU07_05665 [Candidatus Lumbricidophila sp.]|nr:hypothetical protein [Candidatus Lumbricidophila sp.]
MFDPLAPVTACDIEIDLRAECGGRDPDRYNPRVRTLHRHFWGMKPLPNGETLRLESKPTDYRMSCASSFGDAQFTSDTFASSFQDWVRMQDLITEVRENDPDDQRQFESLRNTFASMVIFPGAQVDRQPTINQARGYISQIADRPDLTLECIRLFYEGRTQAREGEVLVNPLAPALSRYDWFFEWFGSFRGYVDFFLLQDLVDDDDDTVKFLLPHTGFDRPGCPQDKAEYTAYRAAAITALEGRRDRMIAALGSQN